MMPWDGLMLVTLDLHSVEYEGHDIVWSHTDSVLSTM